MSNFLVRPFLFFFDFRGRASRKTFWITYLTVFAVICLLFFIENVVIRCIYPNTDSVAARAVLDIMLRLMQIANRVFILAIPFIFIRRLHDLDLSGWWLLAIFGILAFLGYVVVDMDIDPTFKFPIVVGGSLLLLGIIRGTDGNNKFGLDPTGVARPKADMEG